MNPGNDDLQIPEGLVSGKILSLEKCSSFLNHHDGKPWSFPGLRSVLVSDFSGNPTPSYADYLV